MNQLAVLLIICGVVISGCSEAVDDAHDVPTLHLVLDSERSSKLPHSSCVGMVRYVKIDCHVQSDRPVEYDTLVLINAQDGYVEKVGKIEDFDCTKWGRCERLKFVAILAGETQSKRLSLSVRERDLHGRAVPKVVVTLPPARERAALLPRKISYTDATGQKVEKNLLTEYPFNPYNVGSPMEIRVEWREGEKIIGTDQHNEFSEIHNLLKRWQTSYETEDIDAYMNVFWAYGFRYVSDTGTPNDTTDDVTFDDIGKERNSALRVFSLYRNIQIELDNSPEVELNESRTHAEVRTRYKITGFVEDNVSLESGHDGWYAEGDFLFVLQKRLDRRGCEWRIVQWFDSAIHKERIDKVATTFGNVKVQ